MLRSIRLALWLLVGPCRALAPLTAVRPAVTMRRSPAVHSALQTDGDQEASSQQDEIRALRAKLRAAEATIAELQSSRGGHSPELARAEGQKSFEDSRFPLFRKVQSQAQTALDKLWAEDKVSQQEAAHALDGHLVLTAEDAAAQLSATNTSGLSVEKLFQRYDADNSGLIDIEEFRAFIEDASRGVVAAIPSFSEFSVEEEVGRFNEWSKERYETAETMAKDTAKTVLERVNDLGAAAAASLPGAAAKAVPVTVVGGVGSGYRELLPVLAAGRGVPVEGLILAIERQATLTMQLGGFMQLIVKLDQANMRTVRQSWERHGRPATVRELLAAEVAEGVQEPKRLKEGSAALSLLWSMRAKRFWTIVADGFADQDTTEPSSAFGIRAYAAELEPYHGFLFKNTFRTGLLALPSRKEMLGNMALAPADSMGLDACWPGWEDSAEAGAGLAPDERAAACLVELRECSDATKRVTDAVQAVLDEFGLRDDRKL